MDSVMKGLMGHHGGNPPIILGLELPLILGLSTVAFPLLHMPRNTWISLSG